MALSFAIDTSKGETPETVAQRRQMSNLIAARMLGTAPKNVGEGLNAIGQALIARTMMGDADAAQKAGEASLPDFIKAQITGQAVTPSVATPPAVAAQPMGSTSIPAGGQEFTNAVMPLAQAASEKTGIDPRLITAQAALETGYGKSAPGNNLFGIKSHGQPGGNVLSTTEVVDGQPVRTTDSFAAYASPADSANGYADFINKNPRYAPLKAAQGLEAQAAALGKSGYATDPNYGQKVLSIAQKLPAPQGGILADNSPSPLDNAQYPAGPVGAPTAVADAAPVSVADDSGAALPPNAQPTGGALPTAQAVQAASAPRSQSYGGPFANVSTQDLTKAAFNPWLKASNPAAAAAISAEITRRATMDQQASDPMRQLQIRKLEADLADGKNPESVREYEYAKKNGYDGSFQDWIASKRAGAGEYGLNPIWGTGPDGKPAIIQLGKSGKPILTPLPQGFEPGRDAQKIDLGTEWGILDPTTRQLVGRVPKDLRGAEREKGVGEAQGKALASAPADIQSGQNALDILEKIRKSPYIDRGTGITSLGNKIPGTGGYDFNNLVEQAKSGAFLQAIQQMRGLGSLSNAEGGAATAAITRMNVATSKEAFLDALSDYEKIVKQGMARAQSRLDNPSATNPTAAPKGKTASGITWSVE